MQHQLKHRIKVYLAVIITGLAISGITAFPLQTELAWLSSHAGVWPLPMQVWLTALCNAISHTNAQYPFLSYGTDWLAFAHLLLAILFVGVWQDPVKNIWVVQFGIIACVLILPLAFIAGYVRHIFFFGALLIALLGLFVFCLYGYVIKPYSNCKACTIITT